MIFTDHMCVILTVKSHFVVWDLILILRGDWIIFIFVLIYWAYHCISMRVDDIFGDMVDIFVVMI